MVLDSPLLAYRAPEGPEDNLSGTDLSEKFYDYLARMPDDRQVVVVENSDPPAAILGRRQVTFFSKNPNSGRYGLFSITTSRGQLELPTSGAAPSDSEAC